MPIFHLKAVRNIDGFRAELVGSNQLVIADFDLGGVDEDAASWILTGIVLNMAEGDGENGGKGCLPLCATVIFDAIRHRGSYSYADMEFTLKYN